MQPTLTAQIRNAATEIGPVVLLAAVAGLAVMHISLAVGLAPLFATIGAVVAVGIVSVGTMEAKLRRARDATRDASCCGSETETE